MLGALLLALLPFVQASTPEDVLRSAWRDVAFVSYGKMISTDSDNPFRKVEGSVSQDLYGDHEIEVGIQFEFKAWDEWRSGRSRDALQKVLEESSLAGALYERYSVILSYQLNRDRLRVLESLGDLADRYQRAQSVLLKAGRATPKNYLDAKDETLKVERLKSVHQQEQVGLIQKMKMWVLDWREDSYESLDLVSIEEITKRIQENEVSAACLTKRVAEEEYKELDEQLRVLRGRTDQWIQGFEVSQKNRPDDRVYSVGFNFSLPFLSSDDLSYHRQNELLLKKSLKQREAESSQENLRSLKLQILNLIEVYRKQKSKSVDFTGKAGDPIRQLEMKIVELEEKLEMLNHQGQISMLYIRLLAEDGRMNKDHKVNALSSAGKKL